MNEYVENKMYYISSILKDFGFDNFYIEELKNNNNIILIKGVHNSDINFVKSFYNYEEFLETPVNYIIYEIINLILKIKLID